MSSLPAVITPALLSSLRSHPALPRHTWYFIAATTLCQLNRPDEISKVYQHALRHGPGDAAPSHDEQLRISRRMREALIKAAAVGGVPRTINALLELKKVTPEELLDEPGAFSPTARRADIYDTPAPQIMQRGQSFFEAVYGKITRRVMGQMDRSGTEDLGLVARLMYGYVLSNTSVLSAAETSFVMIAGLIPQDVNPQLKGHLRGALNGGATVEQVKAVRSVVVDICMASGMKMLDDSSPAGFGWRNEVADL
ncbi:AhpD-like protein [Parachaetomium inaequale]|uniref:AhpD-like protein n=1 Tax=Parachaetomium inaequale TaxID=2588326 RepID=A0AAN6PQ11_9PEZI|nr:AhpD-like protein [Parachaetomium inaequale]